MGAKGSKPELNLLMVGKTGNGKSSTANTILGREVFKMSTNMSACTKEVGLFSVVNDQGKVNLVDTSGLVDTENDVVEDAKFARSNMNKAFELISCFHALLLVLNFQNRYTAEEVGVTEMMKAIFGSDIIRNHCIVIITHGDNFYKNVEEEPTFIKNKQNIPRNQLFQRWCDEQIGPLQELFRECKRRIVLINNKGSFEEKENSVSKIIEFTAGIKPNNIYTVTMYNRNEENRKKLILTVYLKQLTKIYDDKLKIMSNDLDLILSRDESIRTNCKSLLKELSETPAVLSLVETRVKDFVQLKEQRNVTNAEFNQLKDLMSNKVILELSSLCTKFSKLESPLKLVAELKESTDTLLAKVRADAQGTDKLKQVEEKIIKFQKRLKDSVRHW
ncbi:uncharacterized protein LOC131954279 [Physella acuta]|uniref:uncharacterized protein LOC131954279 n=1 Tax=Physella acuta TaxID=109671 RepID=UPI0027DE3EFA|nr:uncharacterized protein LOC131954279 [Physella acuta]